MWNVNFALFQLEVKTQIVKYYCQVVCILLDEIMARNIFEKKKRVARVKGLNNSLYSESRAPDCIDYVSSIIEVMNSSQLVQFSSFKTTDSENEITKKTEYNKDEKDLSVSSTSKNPPKNTAGMSKVRRFCSNKKYPLMEKSQRVLKQLKHNQSIPKQRAHLSSMPSSPFINNISSKNSKISSLNKNNVTKIKKNIPFTKNTHRQSSEKFKHSNLKETKSFSKDDNFSLKKVKKVQNSRTILKSDDSDVGSTRTLKAFYKNVNKLNANKQSPNAQCVNNINSVVSSKKSKTFHEDDLHSHYDRTYFRKTSLDCDLSKTNRCDSGEHSRKNSSISNRSNRSISNRSNSSISSRSNSNVSDRSNSSVSSRSNSMVNDKSKNNVNDSSINDTTDSEYEKFVERNKKDLYKKSKTSQKKTKNLKKSSKKTVRILSDADSSDDNDALCRKYKKNKKRKVTHENIKIKSKVLVSDESETNLMDADLYTRDSPSFKSKGSESYVSEPHVITDENNIRDDDDDASSIICRKNRKIKVTQKNIKTQSKVIVPDESEVDVIDGSIYARDASPESDRSSVDTAHDSPSLELKHSECYASLSKPNPITDRNNIMDINSSFDYQTPVAHFRDEISCDTSLLNSSKCVEKSRLIYSESSVVTNEPATNEKLENVVPEYIVLSSPEQEYDCIIPDLSLNSVTEDPSTFLETACVKSKESTLNAIVVDSGKYTLKTSTNFEETTSHASTVDLIVPALNATTADSEDSDLEVIDVILPQSKVVEVVCNKAADRINCSTISNEKNLNNESINKIKCEVVSSQQILVSTKQTLDIPIKKENEDQENKIDTDNKHEAIYSTDICKGNDSKNNRKLPQLHSNLNVPEVFKSASSEGTLGQFTDLNVKKEDFDDDVMVIHSVEKPLTLLNKIPSSTDTNTSIQDSKRTFKAESPDILVYCVDETRKCRTLPGIKMENSIAEKENCQTYLVNEEKSEKVDTKLSEVAFSDFLHSKSLACGPIDKCSPLQLEEWDMCDKNVDLGQLLEYFKQEFQTYQKIIEVETNVETKFKEMESKQAEKLLAIRTLIHRLMNNKQSDTGDNSSKIDEAIGKICNVKKLKNLNAMEYKPFPEKSEDTCFQKVQNVSGKLSPTFSTSVENIPLLTGENKVEKTLFSSFSSSQNLVKPKEEPLEESTEKCEIVAMQLLHEKCVICCQNAVAACQRCAKVFFCSNECGIKSWNDGHKDECGKR